LALYGSQPGCSFTNGLLYSFMNKILYTVFSTLMGVVGLAQPLAAAPLSDPTDGRTLELVPNKGQWPSAVRYAGAVPGGHLYLEAGGLRYVLLEPIEHPHGTSASTAKAKSRNTLSSQRRAAPLPAADSLIRGHQLRVRFVGGDVTTPLSPAEATGEVRNYLHGNDPTKWAQAVPSYRQVRYQAPWPGIGARFYENKNQQLEYDFELEAGANSQAIKLKYEGATQLALSSDGRLHVGTSLGELTELAPQAYQTDPSTGQHRLVACHYRLHAADSTVTFELGRYDHARPLVIDPTVIFSTYTGARGSNWGFTATYDAAGNMYSGGIVLDDGMALPSYPTTAGAFQTSFGGLVDISIIKYNTTVTGTASRVWATYVGGSSSDFPSSLVVNSQNELVLLGTTASSNYPTSASAYQRSFRGGVVAVPFGNDSRAVYRINNGTDIVVTRLTSNGSSLSASTYLGGSGNDGLVDYQPTSSDRQLVQNYGDAFRGDILTDAQGNIYIASTTNSTNFPVTGGSFGTSYRGGTCDAVVVKLPPSLAAPTWSGYLGGAAADGAYSLQLDGTGNVYVAGGTMSQNFPNTAAGYMTSARGNVDGFVARIAANGSSVQKATYLGTSSYDQAYFVQIGADGGVYLLGQTLGAWPVSAGVYSNAGSRQFIQKLSPDLDRSLLSTVFGSGRATIDISPTAFLVDQCDRVYACGWGGLDINARASANNGHTDGMPTTANAVRRTADTPGSGADFYLAQFAPGLTELSYGTFYGDATPFSEGDHVDGGTSRFDPRGVVYAAVCSCQNLSGFPVPLGAYTYSPVNGSVTNSGFTGSLCNNAAFKLNFEPTVATVGADQTVCATAQRIALTGNPSGGTWAGPGVTGSVATGFFFTPTPALVGVQTLSYTLPAATTACVSTGQQHFTVTPVATATFNALPQATYCLRAGVTITPVTLAGSPAGGTFSGPGVTGNQFSPAAAGPGSHTLTYTVSNGGACPSAGTRVVQVVGATVGPTVAVCAGSTAVALSGQPAGGTWSGIGVSGSVANGFVFIPTAALSGSTQTLTYTVTAPDGSCAATATQTISVTPLPQVSAPAQPAVCATPTAVPLTGGQPAGGTWSGPGVSVAGTGTYVFTPSQALIGTQTLTYTVTSPQGCSSQATTSIQVLPALVITMPADTVLCPGSSQPLQLKALPAGGTWSGPGVTASGVFTPPASAGTSAVVYTVGAGTPCPVVATRRLTLLAAPSLVPSAQPLSCGPSSAATAPAVAPYTVSFGQPVATLLADAVLTWDFGDGSAPVTGLNVTHTYTAAGSFQPKATLRFNNNRCSTLITLAPIEVQSMLIPNVFTPNGDKQNDYFAPRLGGCQPHLQVFSRWGQKVYDSPAYFNNWDGAGQAAGLYYFLITPPDGSAPIKGWVELIR
jgi:hypothetical protein